MIKYIQQVGKARCDTWIILFEVMAEDASSKIVLHDNYVMDPFCKGSTVKQNRSHKRLKLCWTVFQGWYLRFLRSVKLSIDSSTRNHVSGMLYQCFESLCSKC